VRISPTKALALVVAAAIVVAAVLAARWRRPLLRAHPWTAAPAEGWQEASIERGRDRRRSIALRVPGRWTLHATPPAGARFRFGLAAEEAGAPLQIRVSRRGPNGGEVVRDERWSPGAGWAQRDVDLRLRGGEPVDVEVAAEGADTTLWIAEPEVVAPADVDRPNVLVYVVDCLRADHVQAYGYPRPTTPEIDRIAKDGIVFEDVQSCASWTKPSVACMFTSLYPALHGARTVDDTLDPQPTTIAEAFGAAGYATATWVANPFVSDPVFGLTRGFSRVVQTVDKLPQTNINDVPADAADITRRVVAWLEHNHDRQFFFYLHSLDLHAGYRRRPPFDRLFLSPERKGDARQVDLYDNELAYNDHEIGAIVEALKRLRLYDRTLIVVSADHGEEFGEHGFTRHGHTLYQGLLHVPFVVKLPGSAHRGSRSDATAINLDLAPTLLDVAGLPVPPSFQGTSLRPALEGRALPPRTLFAEQLSPKEVLYAARERRLKLIDQLLPEPQRMLFDLRADAAEKTNLLAGGSTVPTGLAADLTQYMRLAQSGYHLSLASADPEETYFLRVSTDGVFADVQRFSMATGEILNMSPDGRGIEYAFTAGAARRLLVLRTDPPAAGLHLELSSRRGRVPPSQIALGRDSRHPAAVPFDVKAADVQVPIDAMADLLRGGGGARLWYIEGPAAPRSHKATFDPELAQRLRALGYIQ
jgi:arylsulfatase A-like enzyme